MDSGQTRAGLAVVRQIGLAGSGAAMAVVEGYRRPTGRRSSPRRRPADWARLPAD